MTVRCFVAVRLAENLKKPAAEIMDTLRRTGADVKWVEPHNLHFTLKFLEEIEWSRLDSAASAIDRALNGVTRFTVSLGGVGAFPGGVRPRVVWIGVSSGAADLSSLAAKLDREFEKEGFPTERRPFSPHLTLGRVRSSSGAAALSAAIIALKHLTMGSMRVSAVHLMKSTLTPNGPIYREIRSWDLPERSDSGVYL